MQPDNPSQIRLLTRYRYMFRFSLGMFALGVLVVGAGVLAWVASGHMPMAILWGLVALELGGFSAYKVLLSTARILDQRGQCPHA